jgi:hypothetical protein
MQAGTYPGHIPRLARHLPGLAAVICGLLAPRPSGAAGADRFEAYLRTPFPPADGFDHPFEADATAWRRLGEPGQPAGELWTVVGDEPRPVAAIGAGRVVRVSRADAHGRRTVQVEHLFFENNLRRRVVSDVAGLARVEVRAGQLVARGAALGIAAPAPGAAVRFSIGREDPHAFIAARVHLYDPQREAVLVLVDRARHRMRLYRDGARAGDYEVGFGQGAGCKQREGDLRSPCGMYFVVDKSRGPFSGDYADYYGGHWIKINYPNAFDAARGVGTGLITSEAGARIAAAWAERHLPPQDTPLGNGIGFHGWAEEWDRRRDGSALSWGCIVLHLRDVSGFFDLVPRRDGGGVLSLRAGEAEAEADRAGARRKGCRR